MEAWAQRTEALSALKGIQLVFPFENRGEQIGVTLHHPHGQIDAYPYVAPTAAPRANAPPPPWGSTPCATSPPRTPPPPTTPLPPPSRPPASFPALRLRPPPTPPLPPVPHPGASPLAGSSGADVSASFLDVLDHETTRRVPHVLSENRRARPTDPGHLHYPSRRRCAGIVLAENFREAGTPVGRGQTATRPSSWETRLREIPRIAAVSVTDSPRLLRRSPTTSRIKRAACASANSAVSRA